MSLIRRTEAVEFMSQAMSQNGESATMPADRMPGAALYPHTYVWYVFVSALDVMFTWVILHLGGREINIVAEYVLMRWDIAGLVLFKFMLVTVVILICEIVGRRRYRLGRHLGHWAVGITWIPVLLAILQLLFGPVDL